MRFWIIIITVVGLVVFCALYAFRGILGYDKLEEAKEQKQKPPKEINFQSPFSEKKQTTSKHIQIARNSVKFQHRPVPSIEQLKELTNRETSSKDEESHQVIAIPDTPTNTVLLYGEITEVERLAEALRSMDQVIQTCHLKTWVVFVRADKQKGYSIIANFLEGIETTPFASVGGGVFNFSGGINNLQLQLSAIKSNGLIEIVDQPYMQLLHATKSRISTLEEIAIPTTTVSDGIAETSIEFKSVGLTIDVTPYFLAQDRVRLNVEQSNGVVGGVRNIAGNEIPEISTQSLSTSAELRLGQVLILGGVESVSRETRKTWLSKTDIRQTGHLYVVCAVYSTIPKAKPIIDLNANGTFNEGSNLLPKR